MNVETAALIMPCFIHARILTLTKDLPQKVPKVVSAPSPPPAKTLETLQVRLFEERLPAPTMLSP